MSYTCYVLSSCVACALTAWSATDVCVLRWTVWSGSCQYSWTWADSWYSVVWFLYIGGPRHVEDVCKSFVHIKNINMLTKRVVCVGPTAQPSLIGGCVVYAGQLSMVTCRVCCSTSSSDHQSPCHVTIYELSLYFICSDWYFLVARLLIR